MTHKIALDANQRTVRTIFQTFLGVAAGLPLIIHASGIPETATGVVVVLAVAGAITRVMALPVVHNLLPNWLYRSDPASTEGGGQPAVVDD
ncbi:hypothetical protein ABTX82_40065 [Streptomyces lavendulae]|uniref:hypothetical protein n=1 Tax=Streptomyces lavendulae TaxID=1914 RepID=UPI003327D9F9